MACIVEQAPRTIDAFDFHKNVNGAVMSALSDCNAILGTGGRWHFRRREPIPWVWSVNFGLIGRLRRILFGKPDLTWWDLDDDWFAWRFIRHIWRLIWHHLSAR